VIVFVLLPCLNLLYTSSSWYTLPSCTQTQSSRAPEVPLPISLNVYCLWMMSFFSCMPVRASFPCDPLYVSSVGLRHEMHRSGTCFQGGYGWILVWMNDDCFDYHSWRNNVVIAFGILSSFSFLERCIAWRASRSQSWRALFWRTPGLYGGLPTPVSENQGDGCHVPSKVSSLVWWNWMAQGCRPVRVFLPTSKSTIEFKSR